MIQISPFITTYRALNNQYGSEVSWSTINLSHFTKLELSQLQTDLSIYHFPNHKNLVNVNQAWVDIKHKELNIVTEILTGNSIKDYLTKLPRPRANLIKMWCRGILEALDHLKSTEKINYCRLTLESVHIMSNSGVVKLRDYYFDQIFRQGSKILNNIEYTAPEVLHGSVNEKSDIYSFGMLLLEMCTKEAPYAECSNNSEIYQKVKNSVLPESINRIKNEKIQEIIKKCIGNIEKRPSVSELLAYPFFDLNEPCPNIILQSLIPRSKNTNPSSLSIIILRKSNNHPECISFEYDQENDTPELVSLEMIENLELSRNSFLILANEIQKQLPSRHKNLKIFRFSQDCFEPNSAMLPPSHSSQKSCFL